MQQLNRILFAAVVAAAAPAAAPSAGRRSRRHRAATRRRGLKRLDHAAGRVAVETGKRAAHHLDALRGTQAEGRGLALAAGVVLLASVLPSLATQWRHCAYGLVAPREDAAAECPSR